VHYKLLGFSENRGVRKFWFHRIGALGTVPVPFTVTADTSLARQNSVPLQVLPTLCTRLLNATTTQTPSGALTLSESEMRIYAAEEQAAKAENDAKHRRNVRPPAAEEQPVQEEPATAT
jgi:hypothetical protein